jgi:hypothetical protein
MQVKTQKQVMVSKIITPSSNATSKSSPTFLAIRLDFLVSKSLAFN